jgi:hypothetical protein
MSELVDPGSVADRQWEATASVGPACLANRDGLPRELPALVTTMTCCGDPVSGAMRPDGSPSRAHYGVLASAVAPAPLAVAVL